MKYSNLKLHSTVIEPADTVKAIFELRITSFRPVEEVTHLYLHQRYGRAARPVGELKAFVRVNLEPGETGILLPELPSFARRYWSAAQEGYIIDQSTWDVQVGGSSTGQLYFEFVVKNGRSAQAAAN